MHYTRTAHAVEFSYDTQTFRCEVQNYVKDLEGFWPCLILSKLKGQSENLLYESEHLVSYDRVPRPKIICDLKKMVVIPSFLSKFLKQIHT